MESETPSKASALDDFSASATLASLRSIMSRCPAKPFNGLKKAMAAVADPPGKVRNELKTPRHITDRVRFQWSRTKKSWTTLVWL